MPIMFMATVSHSKLKLGSQYDAGTSVASWASGWCWNSLFQRCIASISQHPTNQIVEKFNVKNRIWVVEKILFPVTLVTRMAPASYYEPGLSLHFYDQSINVTFKQHMYMYVHVSLFLVFFPLLFLFLLVITPLHVAVLVSTYMCTVAVLYCNCTILCIVSYTCTVVFTFITNVPVLHVKGQ